MPACSLRRLRTTLEGRGGRGRNRHDSLAIWQQEGHMSAMDDGKRTPSDAPVGDSPGEPAASLRPARSRLCSRRAEARARPHRRRHRRRPGRPRRRPLRQHDRDADLLTYPDWYGPNEFADFEKLHPGLTIKTAVSGTTGAAAQIAQISTNPGAFDVTLAGVPVSSQMQARRRCSSRWTRPRSRTVSLVGAHVPCGVPVRNPDRLRQDRLRIPRRPDPRATRPPGTTCGHVSRRSTRARSR